MKQPLIVYKVGTSSLTQSDGSIDIQKIINITDQLAILHQQGYQLVLVTSGSIAAGFRRLGFSKRPTRIAEKQASAAVGQGLLIEEYTKYLLKHQIVSAQVLLTQDDFADQRRYRNAANALQVLISNQVIPIINENDTIAVEEIKVGDNDTLSAQVASLLKADLLVLLTDVDGLYSDNPVKNPQATFFDCINEITPDLFEMAGDAGTKNGTGGMTTKLIAASLATKAGTPVFICSSANPNAIVEAATQSNKGTLFIANEGIMAQKKQWLSFYARTTGSINIDAGAENAMLHTGSSLLLTGITKVQESFQAGDIISVYSLDGQHLIGKGRTRFSHHAIKEKLSTKQNNDIVIHRDDWVTIN